MPDIHSGRNMWQLINEFWSQEIVKGWRWCSGSHQLVGGH